MVGPGPVSKAGMGPSRRMQQQPAEGLEVNLLVKGAAPEAEVKALVVPVLHGVHYLLGHAHSEGEVTAHLPHHNGGADVLGLDLNVLARHLLGDLQAVGAMPVAAVLGAVGEGGWELVHLRLVHFLVHALLEALEDDDFSILCTRPPGFSLQADASRGISATHRKEPETGLEPKGHSAKSHRSYLLELSCDPETWEQRGRERKVH
uniref:Uncharacterized protein n=1 Tax=Gopherus evgoodei TaxID=1825980 RepID=A0A8C4Y1K3_9SAUR